jgi:uncharacterized delta-60 repeat protein
VVQPDGKILLAGSTMNSYNGVSLLSPGIIRLNPDGSLDTSFIRNTSIGVAGTECELQSDGKILFFNEFGGGYNGDTTKRLVRLNPDGSLDSSFPNNALTLGSTPVGVRVFDIVVDNLDRIYLLGVGLIYSGTSVPALIRLNSNGTVDSSFSDGVGFGTLTIGFPGQPFDMEINDAGSIYAVGTFLYYFDINSLGVNIMKIRNNGRPFVC